ncbi:MAG: hypothetical protein QXY55_02765 [Candidatus Korarchaeota archaeon]|nr:hypothetical protein [Thermoproteota archaeon]
MMGRGLDTLLVAVGVAIIFCLGDITKYYHVAESWVILLIASVLLSIGIIRMRNHYPNANKSIAALFLLAATALILADMFKLHTGVYVPVWLQDAFIVLSIVAFASTTDLEDEFLGVSQSILVTIARAVRSTCIGIFAYWILVKLNIMTGLLTIFGDADKLIIASLLLLIVSAVARNFAINLSLGYTAMAIRGAVITAFWYVLAVGIIASILGLLKLVNPTWSIFLSQIWQATALLFVAAIVAIALIRFEGISPRLAKINIKTDIYSLQHTQSLILPGNIELIVQSNSYLMPLTIDGTPRGLFIFGEISYDVDVSGRNFRGEADRVCIITDENVHEQILGSLRMQPERDVIYFGELFSSAKEALEVLRKHFARHGRSIVELPFIKVYSDEDMDYVKVGPITVIDTRSGEYVGIGPIKIQEGRIDEIKKPFEGTLLAISDLDRGWVFISVRGNRVKVSWGSSSVLSSPRGISVRRGKLTAVASPQEYKLVWGETVVKIRQDAVKVVAGKFCLKVTPPWIKLIDGRDVVKIKDEALANEIISAVRGIVNESPNILEGGRPDRIIDLIRETVKDKIFRWGQG